LLFSCSDSGSFGVPSSPIGQANVFVMDQLSLSLLEEIPSGFFDVGDSVSLQLDPGSGSPWLVFRKVFLYRVPESGLSGGFVDDPLNGWLDFVVKNVPSCFDDDNYAFLNMEDESCCDGACQEVLVEFLDAEIVLPSDLETGSYLLLFAVGEAKDTGEWDVWNWVFKEITVHGEDYCDPFPATCGSGDDQNVLTSCINNHLIIDGCENSCQDFGDGAFCGCFDDTQDPIPLCSCQDLQNMNSNVNANYELQQDIDCSDTINWDDNNDGVAEGFNTINSFSGIFDGQDHVIRNLNINRPLKDYVGLFSQIGDTAIIRSVGLEGGDIRGKKVVGGLVGKNNRGSISSSYGSGSVSGGQLVGGLVGQNFGGSVYSSYSLSSVNGNRYIGGLVGQNVRGSISGSYSSGSVNGQNDVGGLVGNNQKGSISSSYASGGVSGKGYVGGLAGQNRYGSISSSYASGGVSGNGPVGGLVGNTFRGSASNSFWDVESSGMSSSSGGEGKTTSQLKDQSSYPDTWDFNTVWAISPDVNDGYPYLQVIN
jgi:hypothetical protein